MVCCRNRASQSMSELLLCLYKFVRAAVVVLNQIQWPIPSTQTDSCLQRNVLYALVCGSVFSVSLQSSPPASTGPQNSISVVEAVVFGCGSLRKSRPPPKQIWEK